MEKFRISATFPASAETLYKAWMDSKTHSAFTGGEARIAHKKGGVFTAWDGYITGATTELVPYQKIVQLWRTEEFEDTWPDSVICIVFKEKDGKTTLTLSHQGLAKNDGAKYKQGWKDSYFIPMKHYFKK